MKHVLAAAFLGATVLAGTTVPSMALATNPVVSGIDGSFSGTSPTGSKSPVIGTNNTIDYFSFAIPFLGSYTVNASITTAAKAVTISTFEFLSSTGVVLEKSASAAGKYLTLDPISLAAGTYYIGVGATGGNNSKSTGYSGNLSVSQVPLPNSVALFGVALAGLGVAGALRKRRTSAASA